MMTTHEMSDNKSHAIEKKKKKRKTNQNCWQYKLINKETKLIQYEGRERVENAKETKDLRNLKGNRKRKNKFFNNL